MPLQLPYYSSLRHKNHKGFTLLETLLYLSLFGLMMVNILTLGFVVMQHAQKSSREWQNRQEANFIRDKLFWLINNNIVLNPTPGTSTEQLVLRAPDNALITIKSLDQRLVLQYESNDPIALIATFHKISKLSFELPDSRQLIINFELDAKAYTLYQQLWFAPQS